MRLSILRVMLAAAGGLVLGIVSTSALFAHQARNINTPGIEQTFIFDESLAEFPDKRAVMFIGEFEPGASTPIHRHSGTEFLFVLEGEGIVEQPGRDPQKLQAGHVLVFEPNAEDSTFVHQAKNLSDTNRMKTLVLIIHDEGAPFAMPVAK